MARLTVKGFSLYNCTKLLESSLYPIELFLKVCKIGIIHYFNFVGGCIMEQLINALQEQLTTEQISTNETIRTLHGKDETYHSPSSPDIVVFPNSTEEVSFIMKTAQQFNVPVTPFGVGSSLEGHVIPYEHGITIDFSQMNKILSIKEQDLLVTVQPGVTREQLNLELKKYGLFFTVDPGANATLGGMAATNASGTTTVKYQITLL